jgi:putative transcriptional regulator
MSKHPTRRPRAHKTAYAFWLALAAGWLAAGALPASSQEITNGTLLVASPDLTDPNFSKSVVLVLRHDDDGTLGVVLNRPTNLEPAKVFPELGDSVGTYPGRLFRGGPIAPTQLLFLVRGLAAATVTGPEVLDKVFLSVGPDSLADMVRLAEGTDELRVFAGHAAWVPGQLEGEIDAGGWQLLNGTPELVFDPNPGRLWMQLEGREGRAGDVVAALSP